MPKISTRSRWGGGELGAASANQVWNKEGRETHLHLPHDRGREREGKNRAFILSFQLRPFLYFRSSAPDVKQMRSTYANFKASCTQGRWHRREKELIDCFPFGLHQIFLKETMSNFPWRRKRACEEVTPTSYIVKVVFFSVTRLTISSGRTILISFFLFSVANKLSSILPKTRQTISRVDFQQLGVIFSV